MLTRIMRLTLLLGISLLSAPVMAEKPPVAPPLTPLTIDEVHDPANPALPSLQNPEESMSGLPKDRRGEVQWVEALNSGLITPRKSVSGKEGEGEELKELDLDIVMTNTAMMPNVRFPHLTHTRWLACGNCHPDIFQPKRGANPVTMEKIFKGQYCGRCHDKVAFSLFICERCHSVPTKNSGPAWWGQR